MSKIDDVMLKASQVGPKTRDEKGFKQVWFTRPEVKKAIELVLAEVLDMAAPMPGSGDIDDVVLEGLCDFIRREFGVR